MRHLAVIFLLTLSISANALPIMTASGDTYNIRTITGEFYDHFDILTMQPWYGPGVELFSLAEELADGLGDQLGLFDGYGPVFGSLEFRSAVDGKAYCGVCGEARTLTVGPGAVATWAVVPEPATAGLMAIGLLALSGRRLTQHF